MVASHNGKPKAGEDKLLNFNEPAEQKVSWLFKSFIPFGELTALVSGKGTGKSTLARAIAADVTGGPRLPGNRKHAVGSVFWFASEEDPIKTVRPGLLAAGTDCDWVFGLEGSRQHYRAWRPILPRDAEKLERLIKKYGVKLCVFDVMVSYIDRKLSMNNDQQVREALDPLGDVARETGCAMLGIVHPNKSQTRGALERVAGAGAWVNLPRAVLGIVKDTQDKNRRYLKPLAGNLVETAPLMAFDIEGVNGTGCIKWRGEVDADPDRLPDGAGDGDERWSVELVREFIKTELANGPRPAADMLSRLKALGPSASTIGRIRASMGVNCAHRQEGDKQVWYWVPEGHSLE